MLSPICSPPIFVPMLTVIFINKISMNDNSSTIVALYTYGLIRITVIYLRVIYPHTNNCSRYRKDKQGSAHCLLKICIFYCSVVECCNFACDCAQKSMMLRGVCMEMTEAESSKSSIGILDVQGL